MTSSPSRPNPIDAPAPSRRHHCRHCGARLDLILADLGSTPVSNDLLGPDRVDGPEPFYPLRAFVCRVCRLVQLPDFFKADELFREDYVYFSSYSDSWLAHCRRYAETMIERYSLGPGSRVVEIGSNDGALLEFFKQASVSVLGVEPSQSVADAAVVRGIPTIQRFFGVRTASDLVDQGAAADLVVANNVLAHVPDINDFVAGVALILKRGAAATFEFPHLLKMIKLNQFDTIYHEHFSYLSLLAVERIFAQAGLRVFAVDELETHGGSLRVYACHIDAPVAESESLLALRAQERAAGLDGDDLYLRYAEQIRETKRLLLELLIGLKREGKTIVGYGAPAKGNTLLNYCGIGRDMLDFTTDRSPHKQGRFLPGTRLAILPPSAIDEVRPDYVLILPWNLEQEITRQLAQIREWGGRFIVPIPAARIVD
jgi:SAM-dependent methyltransferase